MDKFSELKAAAMAATPGRIGDRIDGSGSIKYECTGYDGSLVLRTNHKDMEYGFVGDNADADELFFRLCVPDVVLELLAELEAKDERIGELEVIATEYAGKFQKAQDANKNLIIMSNDDKKRIAELERANQSQDDHINQQQDRIDSLEKTNAGLGRRLGDAEKRLATPVRLPNKNDDEFWFDNVFQVAKFDRAVERSISAAGFKFVGNE
ncbi:ead/Ea22-like family protein [Serratia ureilytica]|uniref:ead/Ea22-like family protein n=1 Tax=Serratia ureilytica TaxID=300181 RepID=UPI00384D7C3B